MKKAGFGAYAQHVYMCAWRWLVAFLCSTLALAAAATVAQAQEIDWLINSSGTPNPIPAGGTIQYTVTVTNNGNGASSGSFDPDAPPNAIYFTVPTGTTLTAVSPGDPDNPAFLGIANCRVVATGFGAGTALPANAGDRVVCDVPQLEPNFPSPTTPAALTLDLLTSGASDAVVALSFQVADVEDDGAGTTTIFEFDDTGFTGVDFSTTNNTSTVDITVNEGADLALTIDVAPTAPSGSTIDFTVEIDNLGPNDADDYTVEIPVPAGLGPITLPAGCSESGGVITCSFTTTLGPADPPIELDFSAQIVVASGSDVQISASVLGNDPADPVASNNSALAPVSITPGTDLFIGIRSDASGDVLRGSEVIFTLSPGYRGDNPTDIEIRHEIPSNYTLDDIGDITAPGYTVALVGNELIFTLSSGSGPGTNVLLPEIEIPLQATTNGASIQSVATIATTGSPAEAASELGNNTASTTTTIVEPTVDLDVDKTGPAPALAVVGQQYTFDLTAQNLGTAPFEGIVEMRDTIPATLQLDSVSADPGWTCEVIVGGTSSPVSTGLPALDATDPIELVCLFEYAALDLLEPDGFLETISYVVTPTDERQLINSVEVSTLSGPLLDSVPGNNTQDFTLETGVPGNSADILVTKQLADLGSGVLDPLDAGEVQTYEIELINQSLDGVISRDIEFSDEFTQLINNGSGPAEGFVSFTFDDPDSVATGEICTTSTFGATGRLLECDITELAPCISRDEPSNPSGLPACPIVTAEVRHGTDADTIFNTAEIISNTTPDPNLANNASTTSFSQNRLLDLTITKTDPTTAAAGQDISFVIAASVVDDGRANARDVIVTDTLPTGARFISFDVPGSGTCSQAPDPFDIIVASGPDQNNILICELGAIANGGQRTVSVTLQATTEQFGDTLVNSASVALGPGDATAGVAEDDVAPNSIVVDVDILEPSLDILVTKVDTIDPVVVLDQTEYVIEVLNRGPSTAQNIVVTDTLPGSNLSYQSVSVGAGGSCPSEPPVGSFGGTLTCNIPVLAADESVEIRVTMEGAQQGDVANNVTITSDEIADGYDTASGNNQANENTTIAARSDVSLTSKTPSSNTVALEEDFTFDIVVSVASGVGLDDAEDVVLSDTLPTGMVLTGTPTTAHAGASCTGSAGATSFTCDLGTIEDGNDVTVTVPVEILAYPAGATSEPQTFTNTASVTTSTFDQSTGNDSASGSVDVTAASIGGTIIRDFDNDGILDAPTDTPINNVQVTLTGTTDDGRPITRTTTTGPDGTYLFEFLPGGTYSITRGPSPEPELEDGIDTPGTVNGGATGTAVGPDTIGAISLPDDEDGINYNFAFFPNPTIGIAKDVLAQSVNADGTFNVTFSILVENLSLERLIDLEVTDVLAGSAPLFGTFDGTLANPATSAMTPGSYTVLTSPSNGCGGANSGFDGSGDQVVANGFALASGASCTITFQLRVAPTDPLPGTQPSGGQYENQAAVTGVGDETGDTVADTSDNGSDPDPDGDRNADEAGENDPTPVSTGIDPSIVIIKTADTSALSSPPVDGETITYRFEIRNTGNVTLTNITVAESLAGAVVSGSIASLAPGGIDTTSITATYDIDQADIDAGTVQNQATVTGTPPIGSPVQDLSGTAVGNDTPTDTPLTRAASIEVIKTADNSGVSDPPAIGDDITYSFEVRNTGNVTLTNVQITDLLPGVMVSGGPITLGPAGSATAVDTTTFTATYEIAATDLSNGQVVNTARATGTPPSGLAPVTDDDSATVLLPSVGIAKQLTAQGQNPDGTVTATYALLVENLGIDRLVNLEVTDVLQGAAPGFGTFDGSLADPATSPMADATYTIVTGPSAGCGPANGSYNGAGDTIVATGFALDGGASCTITFTIRLAPPDPLPPVQPNGGRFNNQAFVTGEGEVSGNLVNDASDDGANPDSDGDNIANEAGENDSTPLNTGINPSIAIIKTADLSALSSPPALGDTITYRFEIQNTGNVTLFNINVTDGLPGVVVDGTIVSLSPGATDSTTITATYQLTETDLNAGQVQNQATVTGTPPIGDPVTDDSGTTFTDDDPLVTPITRVPGIELIKTADTSGLSDPPQVGEVISYSFEVRNTGNVTLTNVTIADALPGVMVSGGPITLGPPGSGTDVDTSTFTATYALLPTDLENGQVVNTATATGTPPTGANVTGDDGVTVPLTQAPGIELIKEVTDSSSLDDGAQVGDVIFYGFTVTNTGNVPLRNVVVDDLLPGVVVSGSPIALMNPAAAADGTNVNTSVTATYALTPADVANFGVVTNTATATGFYGPGLLLSVASSDNATAQPPNPTDGLTLIKTTPDETVRNGSIVPYTVRLRNDNPFPAINQVLVDTLPVGLVFIADSAQLNGVPVTPTVDGQVLTFPPQTLAPGEEIAFTLLTRVLNGTNPGTYTNEAIVLDPVFGLVAGPATATIRVLPEPIFSCGDVIGRVFDDLDADGYQDAYTDEDPSVDPIEEAKIEDIVRELTQEVGLSGVRLVTLDGLVISTDANGLFSVPCAALPQDRGSNFLLSLDERTLPLGYEMTTMNPRVVRLTPGVLTEMNFGARLARMIRVDLNAQAFIGGQGLSSDMQQGIAAMVARLAEERMRIQLIYHVDADANSNEVAAGRAAMDLVQAEIARQWDHVGRGRLRIEQSIARGGN